MRTTVNLDDDVVAAVDQLRRERGMGLGAAVNELVGRGLISQPRRVAFVQETSDGGARVDIANVAEVLELLDGPATAS